MSVAVVDAEAKGGLALLADLERLGAASETHLALPAETAYEAYEALGFALGRAHRNVTWMIADWIEFGRRAYGEKYAQAVEATGLRPETLMNYASVARRIPREVRRADVSFGVHAEVASLEREDQEMWLAEAARNEWRREDLRARLRPENITPALGFVGDLEEAARDLVRSARAYGDDFIVRRPSFVQLCAALGEEA